MSNRRFTPALTGAALLAALGLATACSMPEANEPPPGGSTFAEGPPPELYGGPARTDCSTDPYPAPPSPDCFEPAEPRMYAEAPPSPNEFAPPPEAQEPPRRPGWGTMAPIPNPPERGRKVERAYAEADRTVQEAQRDSGRTEADRELTPDERAYAYGPPESVPYAPRGYVEVRPARPGEAPYAEGVPAYASQPLVVTMEPVPNPEGASARTERRERARRRAADEGLLGGPAARSERRARAAATAAARPTTRAATQPARRAAAQPTPAKPKAPAAQAKAPARVPAANMDQFRNALAQLVQRDSTFTTPGSAQAGRTEQVTLTLPATLAESMARAAERAGVKNAVTSPRIRAQLSGDGWRIRPDEPQTEAIRAGKTSGFTWRATPTAQAGPLQATVEAEIGAAGRKQTLQLAQLTAPAPEGLAAAPAEGRRGGLDGRAIGAAVLLVLLLLAAFFFLRRGDDAAAGAGRARRRRYREPVNLTPYAPPADGGGRDATPA